MPNLAPLRDGSDPRAEYRLLVERKRQLREELADLDVIMDGVILEIALGREGRGDK